MNGILFVLPYAADPCTNPHCSVGEATMRRIRLFRIFDASGKICFDKLLKLASSKVKYTHHQDVRLSYLDVDDDCVIVDSAEDLVDAIDQFSDSRVLRLFVGEVTPAMRQAYLQVSSGDPKQPMGNVDKATMEHEIERQIEQVLEKRFRILEQQRRVKETTNSSNSSTPRTLGLLDGQLRRNCQATSPHHAKQQPYGNRGWDEYDDMIGDDYMSNENPASWQWEDTSADDRLHSRPPKIPSGITSKQRSLSMDFQMQPGSSAQIMDHEYDLTARTSQMRRQGSFRSQRDEPSPVSGLTLNDTTLMTPRRRSNSMTMRNAAQARGVIDSKAEIEVFRNMMSNVRRPGSPGAIHRKGRDDVMLEQESQQDYGSDDSDSQVQNNEHYQDWETNTVDSDAELSLLLSDAEFRGDADHRDDQTLSGKSNIENKPMKSQPQQSSPEVREDSPRDQPPLKNPQPKLPPKPPSPVLNKNNSNNRPATPTKTVAESKFNNIPRPTPPKKNKLIGMLYNNE